QTIDGDARREPARIHAAHARQRIGPARRRAKSRQNALPDPAGARRPPDRPPPRLAEPDRVDRREVVADRLPAIAAGFAHVEVAGSAAEGQRVAAVAERVPVDHVVRALPRQALAELLPAPPAVPGARDAQAALHRNP